MADEKKMCLSARGLTREFGFGRHRNVAVYHLGLDLYEG